MGQIPTQRYPYPQGSGGDDLFSSAVYIDDIRWNTGCAGEWQLNGAAASLDINGLTLVDPLGASGAVTTAPIGVPVTLNIGSTLLGNVHDLGVVLNPLLSVSAGGVITGGGQTINLAIADPSLFFLFGPDGLFSSATPVSNYTIPFTPTLPGLIASAQLGVIDPASPDGVSISQGSELRATN